jgi:hydroxyacylglutathione hydrolase
VDVRGSSEFQEEHIDGSEHVFVGTLQEHLGKINREQHVIIYCQSGDRASIAYSILKKYGFENVKNYMGGMKEWQLHNVDKNQVMASCR